MFDVIIRDVAVVDGTGCSYFYADVGLKGAFIEAVGTLGRRPGKKNIDGTGMVLAPGFIDIHTHSDQKFLLVPKAHSKISQGVTTEVLGQCGSSVAPLLGIYSDLIMDELHDDISDTWQSFGEYLNVLSTKGIPVNVIGVVGHGTIRKQVMGYQNREPSLWEFTQMKQILHSALQEGAIGMSTGLGYAPGSYASTQELIELARVVKEFEGIYMTHLRNEGDSLEMALQEAIEIGRQTGVKIQISHLKALGRKNWGKVKHVLSMVEAARLDGIDMTIDHYPYRATSTELTALLPKTAMEGGRTLCLKRLANPQIRKPIKRYLTRKAADNWKWSEIQVARVRSNHNKWLEGKHIEEIAKLRREAPEESILNLLVEEKLACQILMFSLEEGDIRTVMRNRHVMIGSDGSSFAEYGPLGVGKPHPRNYGTFPRVLGKYVRSEKVLGLEEAVFKMTGQPASRLGLWDRGFIRPGMAADLVLFDPTRIRDTATFEDPRQIPEGIQVVFLNGHPIISRGEFTGHLKGKVLYTGTRE